MTDLEHLLNAANRSPGVRRSFFMSVYNRGYFPQGLALDAAARQFDADLLADTPRRQQLLGAYLPYHLEDGRLAKKMGTAIACSALGFALTFIAVADPKRNEVLEQLGPLMAGGCGLMAGGYALRRKFV